ncbi:MAG: hypothetical protein AAGG48_10630 [Planctomycetota bacterium]
MTFQRCTLTLLGAILALVQVTTADDLTSIADVRPANLRGIRCVVETDQPIDPEIVIAYKNARLYFSSKSAVEAYLKTPATYEAYANHQVIATKQYEQLACPLSGEEPDEDSVTVKIAGVDVQLLCEECAKELAKDTRKEQIEMLFDEEGFKLGKFQLRKSVSESMIRLPKDQVEWEAQRNEWMASLRRSSFASWPDESASLKVNQVLAEENDGVQLRAWEFESRQGTRLRLYVAHRSDLDKCDLVVLNPVDEKGWKEFASTYRVGFPKQFDQIESEKAEKSYEQTKSMFRSFAWAMAYVQVMDGSESAAETTEVTDAAASQDSFASRVWDIRRAIQALRSSEMKDVSLWLQGTGRVSDETLFASLFEPGVTRLDLYGLNPTSVEGAASLPQAVALAMERTRVVIYQDGESGWELPIAIGETLGRKKQLQIRPLP